jgi:glutamate formiminotransferase
MKLVECVPNISEGRDRKKIEKISAEVQRLEEIALLNVDSDPDHNRTVITFVGSPQSVAEATVKLVERTVELIDLRHHQGEHPRMGAVDVIPLVPVWEITMAECIELSKKIGKEIAERFAIPVYLYEESATKPERKDLSNIRKGEFEGFGEKIKQESWAPDFGPQKIHPSAGVVAVGARMPLIAYNVNLGTDDLEVARKIAAAVRGSSGGFTYVKAMGFRVEERGIVQVSMNLTDYRKTPLFRVFELVKREAERYGVPVISSEIVGLAPQGSINMVAEYYLQLENFSEATILEKVIAQYFK